MRRSSRSPARVTGSAVSPGSRTAQMPPKRPSAPRRASTAQMPPAPTLQIQAPKQSRAAQMPPKRPSVPERCAAAGGPSVAVSPRRPAEQNRRMPGTRNPAIRSNAHHREQVAENENAISQRGNLAVALYIERGLDDGDSVGA